jgi:hypothetical protein
MTPIHHPTPSGGGRERKRVKYRKKPIEVEALQLVEGSGDPHDVAKWCGGRVVNNFGHPSGKVAIAIRTLEGEMTAQYGDWIIKGIKGEFYPCKSDIFEASYEPVPTTSDRREQR